MHSRSIQHYLEHIIAKIDNTKLSYKAIATEQSEIDFNAQFRRFHINRIMGTVFTKNLRYNTQHFTFQSLDDGEITIFPIIYPNIAKGKQYLSSTSAKVNHPVGT